MIWCIDLTKLFMGLLWVLTIFNFMAIFLIVCFKIHGWDKTADTIFRYRYYGNYKENTIGDITKDISDLKKYILSKEEEKKGGNK